MSRIASLRALALAALVGMLAPDESSAQQSVMRGRVVTADSAHRPIEGAEIAIAALRRVARTAADGEFSLAGLPNGAHVVVVRRLGFVPITRGILLSGEADDTAAVTFALAAGVRELPTVVAREEATAPRGMERERARSNGGAFIDREVLERNEHSVMSNVLRRVPGVSLVRYPSSKGAYYVIGSARGQTRIVTAGRPRSPYCFYQIYVDGLLRYAPSEGTNAEPPPDVDELKIADYEAIEIYRGGAQVPSQYGGTGAACGTVLLWSRTR